MRVRLCRSDVLGMSEAAAPVTKPFDSCRTQKFSSSSRPLRSRQRAGLAAGPGVRSVFQFGELVVSAVGACGKGFGIARDANDVAAVVAKHSTAITIRISPIRRIITLFPVSPKTFTSRVEARILI